MALRPSFVVLPISSPSRAHKPTRGLRPICSAASAAHDNALLIRAAEVADYSAGHTAPHPNFGCVIARNDEVVGEGFLYAQGTKCAELQAVEAAGELARGATAYLNMEPGDCYADQTPVSSLVQAGISRVVVGIRHPLGHLRGKAINFFRNEGVRVDVVGEDLPCKKMEKALRSCLLVNAPLLYRAAFHVPFSVLKYAMTLDGKIAAISGDASWVSSRLSRGRVFELRGRSDAIVVGGNTVRQDDPRLTARHGGGHVPVRIVMSKSLNLPEEANLWNTRDAYTIIATQRGARKDIQEKLAKKGVEVVEFDMLNPRDVMEYCCSRGCLSVLWECGGELAAAAIGCGVIHKNPQQERRKRITWAATIAILLLEYYRSNNVCIPRMTSNFIGDKWVGEMLSGHPIRFNNIFRMSVPIFIDLLHELFINHDLQGSSRTATREVLAITLYILSQNESIRGAMERFQYLSKIICRYFSKGIQTLVSLTAQIVKSEDPSFASTPGEITNDPHCMPYFKNCIGAIDDTHIDARLPSQDKVAYIGRSGLNTQNALVVCDFNMCFTFVMAGWERSAHDSRIFFYATRNKSQCFPHPLSENYYLVDAGYPMQRGYLKSYPYIRCHIPDFERASDTICGRKEMFNKRHSLCRVIKRRFGVWKKKCVILRDMPSYPF